MITMYAAVANRTGEIGTLRALGFRRRSIMIVFLLESLLLVSSAPRGHFCLVIPAALHHLDRQIGRPSRTAFSFTLTTDIVIQSLVFSLIMGFVGGVLPAFRASRMNIVEALRAS